jgi:hypothetical protein
VLESPPAERLAAESLEEGGRGHPGVRDAHRQRGEQVPAATPAK